MINIIADKYLYNIQSYLPENINLILFDPSRGLPESIQTAHGLLVRTVIPINRQTLPDIPDPLSFIGTASAGTDHVDIDYLLNNEIAFADAAGCNAWSVAEYVLTSLLIWTDKRKKNIQELSVGVIGAGHVGSRVLRLLKKIGVSTVAYDPPREKRETGFRSASQEDLQRCDILTFHTPLTFEGEHPTHHWLDARKLAHQNYELIINTSRGGVIDEQAVLQAMEKGRLNDIILDVWENEPRIDLQTAGNTFIKTPHIAGYSVQAKENASKFVAKALLNHFGLAEPSNRKQDGKRIISGDLAAFTSLTALLTELHPVKEYEAELERILKNHPRERGEKFNQLRAEFPLRQEFPHTYLPSSYFKRFPILRKLGFAEK